MKILISENKIEQLKIFVQETIDSELENVRNEAEEEWGLGEMDELDELYSVDRIVVVDIKKTEHINIYVNVYISTDREEFDNIFAMINYLISQWIPNSEVHIEKVYI
jgi:hypothetical protein